MLSHIYIFGFVVCPVSTASCFAFIGFCIAIIIIVTCNSMIAMHGWHPHRDNAKTTFVQKVMYTGHINFAAKLHFSEVSFSKPKLLSFIDFNEN